MMIGLALSELEELINSAEIWKETARARRAPHVWTRGEPMLPWVAAIDLGAASRNSGADAGACPIGWPRFAVGRAQLEVERLVDPREVQLGGRGSSSAAMCVRTRRFPATWVTASGSVREYAADSTPTSSRPTPGRPWRFAGATGNRPGSGFPAGTTPGAGSAGGVNWSRRERCSRGGSPSRRG